MVLREFIAGAARDVTEHVGGQRCLGTLPELGVRHRHCRAVPSETADIQLELEISEVGHLA
jgi:hypothetical protein